MKPARLVLGAAVGAELASIEVVVFNLGAQIGDGARPHQPNLHRRIST